MVTGLDTVYGSDVLDFSSGDFKSNVEKHNIILVEFFTYWCKYCRVLAPEYEKAATILKDDNPSIPLAKVDCDRGKPICSNGIRVYPTLIVFEQGEPNQYNGSRTSDGIVNYMRSQVA